MYAQKIEGDSWMGEKIDGGKIDKMSGTLPMLRCHVPASVQRIRYLVEYLRLTPFSRPAAGPIIRAHAGHTEQGKRRRRMI